MLKQYKSMIGVNSCRGALDISPWEPITMAIGMAAYRKTTRFWADPNISAGQTFLSITSLEFFDFHSPTTLKYQKTIKPQAGNEFVQGAQKNHHMKQN